MKKKIDTQQIPIGVVGLGLMGCSISTCLLMAGHPVVAVAPLPVDMLTAEKRIHLHLQKSLEAQEKSSAGTKLERPPYCD